MRGCISAAADEAALCDCLSGAEVEGEEEEADGEEGEEERAARGPIPGGSASRSNLCKRLHTKLMGSRRGPYSDEETEEERGNA